MRTRLTHLVIIAAFSAGAGHLAWFVVGPPRPAEYVVGGDVTTLKAPEPRGKNLYLRRSLYLPRRPKTAWIRVLGQDRIELYVNGANVGMQVNEGHPVALFADLTAHMQSGKNVLAIAVRQITTDHLPEVAVSGAYWLDDVEHRFGTDGLWKFQTVFDRRADYWFTVDFDDGQWLPADRGRRTLAVTLAVPPWAITSPNRGKWIGPDVSTARNVGVRRDFELPERPRRAWLRVWCTASFRLAVNGTVVDAREEQLAATRPPVPAQWIYDVSPLVRKGTNALCLATATERPAPRALVDMEVEGASGKVYHVGTDAKWLWRPAAGAAWLTAAVEDPTQWHACHVEEANLGGLPGEAPRRPASVTLPLAYRARMAAAEGGLIVLIALATWGVTWLAGLCLPRRGASPRRRRASPAVIALVPSAVLLAAGMMAVHDPRIPDEWVYQPVWLKPAIALVVVQWVLLLAGQWLVVALRGRERAGGNRVVGPTRPRTSRFSVAWLAMLVCVIGGGYLRITNITTQPLSPDESTVYHATQGFLERGFPGGVVSEDMPALDVATSELIYLGTGLAALVFEDERLIVRSPPVFWGTLTIFLLFLAGRRMFDPWVGATAAAIYAFAPYCVYMSNVGRYYSQLQGFALLTVYLFYRLIEPAGPLIRRRVYLTAASFTCMYLSWEGSALLGPALVAAALVSRRDRIRTVLCDPSVWIAGAGVAAVVAVQQGHRMLQQTLRPLFGSGSTGVTLTPMWTYPQFDLWYYVRTSSWTVDTLIPTVALLAAGLLMVRHRFRKPARALFIVFLGAAFFQAAVLPVTAGRYAYHLLPMLVILAAAAIVAAAEQLTRVAHMPRRPLLGAYARLVSATFVIGVLTVSNGLALQLTEMDSWRRPGGGGLNVLRAACQDTGARFVRDHMRPGDVVIVNTPHLIDHYLGAPSDFWMQTQMQLQATLDDRRTMPIHRLVGTVMVPNLEQVQEIWSRHRRVWFIALPSFNAKLNARQTSEFVRQNMDMVYEDLETAVLFRGENHLPADLRSQSEESLKKARAKYLP